MFAFVKGIITIMNAEVAPEKIFPVDLSNCFTSSFPEFVPFCAHLYDYSTSKDFILSTAGL